MKLKLLIKPVSVNMAYPSDRSGRRHLSKEGKVYKETLGWAAKSLNSPLLTGHIGANYTFGFADKRRRDVDDYIKLTQDALSGICFVDDSQIIELTAKKQPSKEPFVEIELYQIN